MNFHPDRFCFWTTQQRKSRPTKGVPILEYLHLVCTFEIDQCFHLSMHTAYRILCVGELFLQSHLFLGPRESCPREMAPDRNVEREILEIGKIVT